MKVSLTQRLIYCMARAVMFAINLVPEFLIYRCANMVGEAYYLLSNSRQAYALKILRNAFPEGRSTREMHRMARRGTGNLMMVAIDMIRLPRWIHNGRLRQRVDATAFDEKLPKLPVVAITAHLGSWEPGGAVLAGIAGEAHFVARKFKNPLLQRYVLESRGQAGMIIHPRRGGIRHMARTLKNGGLAVQVGDQYQRLRGVEAPFFGEVVSSERSAASLALRQSCPVFIACCIRQGYAFRFKVYFQAIIHPKSSDNRELDLLRLVTQINEEIGQMAVRHHDQYLWIHNRYHIKLDSASALSSP